MPGHVLGVDAGGSGTQAVLLDRTEKVLRRWELPPMNALFDADAVTPLSALIVQSGAVAAGLGLAGIRSQQHADNIKHQLIESTGIPVVVADDAAAALAGAVGAGPGIVIIAGTGTMGIGRAPSGAVLRGGGFGFVLGDEGGGYWIGRRVAGIALKSAAGLIAPELLIESLVFEAFGGGPAVVETAVYAAPADRLLLARLVPAAVAVQRPVVHQLLTDAADHLLELAHGMRRVVGEVPVVITGGLWNIDQIRQPFTAITGASPMPVSAAVAAARLWTATPPDAAQPCADPAGHCSKTNHALTG